MKFNLQQIYIAVEGPPGTGKSLLAEKLSQRLNSRVVLDKKENPFLKDFYKDPEKNALSMQLHYLVERYNQQLNLPEGDLFHQNLVADYIYQKDQMYANYNLDDKNLTLYNQLQKVMDRSLIKKPDLVVYLHMADSRELFEKIKAKERSFETDLNEEYITGLNSVYHYFFERYRETPMFMVNAANFSADVEEDLDKIFEMFEKSIEPIRYIR